MNCKIIAGLLLLAVLPVSRASSDENTPSNKGTKMPQTLRDIAGAPKKLPPLNQSVILIIDAQKEYTTGRLPLSGIDDSVNALAAFLQKARAEKIPVIHIVHHAAPTSPLFAKGGEMAQIIDALKPIEGEPVVVKTLPSSFTGTTLLQELEKIGRKNLLVCGYMTHMCLSSTTREAAEKGFACTIVAKFTATRDLPSIDGGVIPAETVKATALAELADRFALIVDSPEKLGWK